MGFFNVFEWQEINQHFSEFMVKEPIKYWTKSRAKLTPEKRYRINQYYCNSWRTWITRKVYCAIHEDPRSGRLASNICVSYIMKMHNDNQCCAISKTKLTHDKSLYSLSIDRIDNTIGHIKENVQLVSMAINLAKNRHTDLDVRELIDNICTPIFSPVKLSRDYASTCVRNAIAFDIRKHRLHNINTDYVLQLYARQGGICALSGIKLACYAHPMFSMSIDRIDNAIGHIEGNVRLICKSLNRVRGLRPDSEVLKWLNDVRRVNGYEIVV